MQNIDNRISKKGLIRLYRSLLADKRIEYGGCAHRRLMKMMDGSNWWNKI